MREIKFRAYNRLTEKMLVDQPVNIANGIIEIGGYYDDLDDTEEVSPSIMVMQYTGLKDSAGKEIYEGDLVTSDCPDVKKFGDKNWTVEYAFTGMYVLSFGSFKIPVHDLVFNKWKLEVVGNVWENPELAK